MKVIANCQLHGDYGSAVPNQEIEVRDDTASELLRMGSVRLPGPPKIQYETKIITPIAPEVSAREPFRDGVMSNQEPAPVASEGPRVLTSANILEPGTVDSRRRARRSGSDSAE